MAELVAQVFGDGVLLSRRGAQLVDAALELVARQAAQRDGGLRPSAELETLRTAVRLAAAGRVGATSGQPFTVVMPASEARVTVAQAAAIRGVSQAAIRKAIAAGRLDAERHGPAWSIREVDARQLKIRRRRDGQARAAAGGHGGRAGREDHPGPGGDVGEVDR